MWASSVFKAPHGTTHFIPHTVYSHPIRFSLHFYFYFFLHRVDGSAYYFQEMNLPPRGHSSSFACCKIDAYVHNSL